MHTVTLGRTGITVGKNAFGALPIQRISKADAVYLLRKAYDNGITFFDTARGYSDSEEKLGAAFGHMRDKVILATKSMSADAATLQGHIDTSLRTLGTDYIDIFQLHNPAKCYRPGDEDGMYDVLLKAKEAGKIRFISLSNHRHGVAKEAVESGLYDTLQYPFSYLSEGVDLEVMELCREKNVGFIAMKALSGGILNNAAAAFAYLNQFDHVLPIWGIQRESELDEFIAFGKNPPTLTPEIQAVIDADRKSLGKDFCRACGYCMPCPVGIEINTSARIIPLLGRAPYQRFITRDWQERMARIDDCLHCGQCTSHCPYGLDTPQLLADNFAFYKEFVAAHSDEVR